MIIKLVGWVLYALRIKERPRPKPKPALEALLDILPCIFAAITILGALRWLAPEGFKIPWYKRFWWSLKAKMNRFRAVVIGC